MKDWADMIFKDDEYQSKYIEIFNNI